MSAELKEKQPARKFTGDELVVATHNNGKLRELREMFGNRIAKLTSAAE